MDISRARIAGTCQITFGGIDIGHTLDGVEFEAVREFTDVTVDRYGTSPIDKVLTGSQVNIKFKLAQADWRQLDLSMPETSSYDGAGSLDRIDLGGDAGYSLRQDAKQLVIHPLKNGASTLDDIVLYKAVSSDNVVTNYKIDEQQVVEITMSALVDESYGSGRRLGHIGSAAVS